MQNSLRKFRHIQKRLVKAIEINSFMGRKEKEKYLFAFATENKQTNNRNTFSKWVKCVNHELEDAVPH